ncbi:MAG: DsbA family protein [Solirubrobacterales bacterium]|nr:DsbA family protein [Solirubrobacterales bacterium]
MRPVFFYDVSSPYAYLGAARVDEVLPVSPEWCPIAFGVIVRQIGKVPWSFASDREARFSEIARRAAERGLPEVRYPEGWPAETYSLTPLRALMLAADQQQLRTYSRELFRTMFVEGQHLADLEAVLDAAQRAGLDRDFVAAGVTRQEVKDRLRAQTEAALAAGVTGVPTVAVGDQLFWGDDRLEEAAAAL